MTHDDEDLLGFVKVKLEENGGVSQEALARILSAAGKSGTARFHRGFLVAASFAAVVCALHFIMGTVDVRRENNVANAIALLRAADGEEPDSGPSLSEALYAWQDSPSHTRAD